MTAPFLALITPLSDARPDNTLPVPQPPVDPGYSPPWARPQPPYIDNTLPRPPGVPTHPIYNPAYPDNTLPGSQPRPDNTLPQPPLGIWGGGNVPMPTPPIYIPPEGAPPPLGIWGPPQMPGAPPVPTHPIVLPPDLPEEIPDVGPVDWKTGWTEKTGWIIVGIPNNPVPTPSRR